MKNVLAIMVLMAVALSSGCEIVIEVPDNIFPDAGTYETVLINMCPAMLQQMYNKDAGADSCIASICEETCKRVTLFCGVEDAGNQCIDYCKDYTIDDVECLLDGENCIEMVKCFGKEYESETIVDGGI